MGENRTTRMSPEAHSTNADEPQTHNRDTEDNKLEL